MAGVRASATWSDGERFVCEGGSGHALVLDAERHRNSGPGPMEMVLTSLCACSATDVVLILRKARQELQGLEVRAEGKRAADPPQVYTHIHMTYQLTGANLDPAAVARAVSLSQSKYCSVLAMLSRTAAISHEIDIQPAAGASAAGRES